MISRVKIHHISTNGMERSIGRRMAELEPIKGYNCKKTIISHSQERLFGKNYFQITTPPRPFNFFEQTLHYTSSST